MILRNAASSPPDDAAQRFATPPVSDLKPARTPRDQGIESRRKPRKSLIVVLPDNYVVSPERLAERLPSSADDEVDIIVACAGQPLNLSALQRTVRDAQFLLAPAGTSPEDLRELAMQRAPGDIVTVLRGVSLPTTAVGDREIFTST